MQHIRTLQRVTAFAAAAVAAVLLICGTLFTHPMPEHGAVAAMNTAVPMGSPSAGTHVVSSMDGGCAATGMQCPLASAQAPTTVAGSAIGHAATGWVTAAATGGPVPSLLCARPRAPDLDSLCVSRT
ncbi:hypothetical protein AB0P15_37775 [Streptomyces sp. NPDC087917]|uniref:hypothetical protein n=1 Tax=Streptomyces sp. NPDC087917 TaxID=3155060 RepID=UPI00342BE74D